MHSDLDRAAGRSGGRSSTSRSSLSLAFGTLAAAGGYWAVIQAPELTRSPTDAAVIAAARTVPRGAILDRDGESLARNEPDANGELYRVYAERVDQPRRRLRLAAVRASRPRAGLRRRAGRPGRRPGARRAAQVRRATRTTRRT